MNSIKEDTKMLREIDFFLREDFDVYLNFKRNISAAYVMKILSDAESAFEEGNTQDYLCYSPIPGTAATFLDYCHLQKDASTPYLMMRKDKLYSAVFCVDDTGVITQRKHIFDLNKMNDIYKSFENRLQACKPGEITAQVRDNTLNLMITKGLKAV